MSAAEQIYDKTKKLPTPVQQALLQIVEELSLQNPKTDPAPAGLTLRETVELRAKLSAWEEDWNAPGMEAYDRP